MLTLKRFEREYLSYRIKDIKDNYLMRDDIKNEMLATLDKYKQCREKGLITTEEFINIVCHVGSYTKEV